MKGSEHLSLDSRTEPGRLVPPLLIGNILASAVTSGLYAKYKYGDDASYSGDFGWLQALGVIGESYYFGFNIGSPLGSAVGINLVDRRGVKVFFYDLIIGYIPPMIFNLAFLNKEKARYISTPISCLILTPIFVYYSHKHFSKKYVIRESNDVKVLIYPMIEPSDLYRKKILTVIGVTVSLRFGQ